MNFYAGTLGQLVIVEIFVFWIWLNVLLDALQNRGNDGTLAHKKLLLTSLGLVLNAAAITGIMGIRVHQLIATQQWPLVWGIVAFYVVLAIGNFMFIVSASIGSNLKLFKTFIAATLLWTAYVSIIGLV